MGYESVKNQPTRKADFITPVHKTTYLFVMWAAVCINLIQMLLQVPVCRRGTNLLFLKYAFLTTVVKHGLKKSYKSISELTILSLSTQFPEIRFLQMRYF